LLLIQQPTFQRCDLDGDGKLSFKEFEGLILRCRERKIGKDNNVASVDKSNSERSVMSGLTDFSSWTAAAFSAGGSERRIASESKSREEVIREIPTKTQIKNRLDLKTRIPSSSTSEIHCMTKSKSVGVSKQASTGMIRNTIAGLHTRQNTGSYRRASRRIKQSTSTDTGIFSYSTSGGISKSITAYDSMSTIDSVSNTDSVITVNSLETTDQNDILNKKGSTSGTEEKAPIKAVNKVSEGVDTEKGVDYRYAGWIVILCCFFLPCVEF
jgi:hypothetical protein